jgi:trigger factor
VRRGKALAQIVEAAVITDESGNVVDLKSLQPDGSLLDPDAVPAADGASEESDSPVDTDAQRGDG